MHKSPAVTAAEQRLEAAYERWSTSSQAAEVLAAAREEFFAGPDGEKVRAAAVKAALAQLEPAYRAEHPYVLKSKDERQRLFLEWATGQPQWADALHRELVRFRPYRDAESRALDRLLEVFQDLLEVRPLVTALRAAQAADDAEREHAEAARHAAQEAETPAPPPPPAAVREAKRAAKRDRRQQLEARRAEEARARDEHRLRWLSEHGRHHP